MLKLVILACLGSATCTSPRVDIHAEEFASPIGCAVAGNVLRAVWEAQNPGWRVTKAVCVPKDHLARFLDEAIGREA